MASNRKLVMRMLDNAGPGERTKVLLACDHIATVTRYKSGKLPQTVMCEVCRNRSVGEPKK